MTYERQEQAFDPIGNLRDAAERADFAAITSDGFEPGRTEKDNFSDIDRIQAERDAEVGRATPITRYRTLRATIDAAWMEGYLTGRPFAKRRLWPSMAACDAEEQMADLFESRPSRIQISLITLSEGWSK